MDETQVGYELGRFGDAQVAGGHQREVAGDLVVVEFTAHAVPHCLEELVMSQVLDLQEGVGAGDVLRGLVKEPAQEGILEPVPEVGAGAEGIGERVQGEHPQGFERLDLVGEGADYSWVIEIAALGDLRHEQVVLDQPAQGLGVGGVQAQPFGRMRGQPCPGGGMIPLPPGFT